MWKYVSRRIRDSLEKGCCNHLEKRSATGLANVSNTDNEEGDRDRCKIFQYIRSKGNRELGGAPDKSDLGKEDNSFDPPEGFFKFGFHDNSKDHGSGSCPTGSDWDSHCQFFKSACDIKNEPEPTEPQNSPNQPRHESLWELHYNIFMNGHNKPEYVNRPRSPKQEKQPYPSYYKSSDCSDEFKKDYNSDSNNNKWNFEQLNRSWIGAITWSSALVLSWYTSQLMHFRYKWQMCVIEKKRNIDKPQTSILSVLYPYVANIGKNQQLTPNPPTEIKQAISGFIPTVHLVSNEHSGVESESASEVSTDDSNLSNDLGQVLNSIETKLGVSAIENGHHKDGLNLLRSAANRNHAPALFNLGLCYEMGLGVPVDEKMAMELYRSAAALEHVGAMYNLGIYYGQGRGGLVRDRVTATRLLRLAAVQGHESAIEALKNLDIDVVETPPPRNDNWSYSFAPYTPDDNVPVQSKMFLNIIQPQNCEATVY